MRLVCVSWLDTVEHPSGWYQPEDVDKLEDVALVHSYGLILKENEESQGRQKGGHTSGALEDAGM